jgi:predicted kinase
MANLIIIRGYPGSGKTTIGKLIQKKGIGIFIDHNAILTFIAGIVGNDDGIYDDIHKLELIMTSKLLKEGESVIVARGFSGSNSIDSYLKLADANHSEAIVIRLEADFAVLKSRVTSPERKKDFNPTVNSEALNHWISSNPLEKISGEFIIDASEDVTTVLNEIESLIKSN